MRRTQDTEAPKNAQIGKEGQAKSIDRGGDRHVNSKGQPITNVESWCEAFMELHPIDQ